METENLEKEAQGYVDMFYFYDWINDELKHNATRCAIKHVEGLIQERTNCLVAYGSQYYGDQRISDLTQIKEILTKRLTQ